MSGRSRRDIIDAVCLVLKWAGTPLHFRDIASRMTASGLWSPPYDDAEEWLDAIICEHIRVDPYRARLRRDDWGVFELSLSEKRRGVRFPASQARSYRGGQPLAHGPCVASNEIDRSLVNVAWTVMLKAGENQRLHVNEVVKRAKRMRLLPPNLVNAELRMAVALKLAIREQHAKRARSGRKAREPYIVNPAEGYFQLVDPGPRKPSKGEPTHTGTGPKPKSAVNRKGSTSQANRLEKAQRQQQPTKPSSNGSTGKRTVSTAKPKRAPGHFNTNTIALSVEEAASRILADAKRPLYYLEIARTARQRQYTLLPPIEFALRLELIVMQEAQWGTGRRFAVVGDDRIALASWAS